MFLRHAVALQPTCFLPSSPPAFKFKLQKLFLAVTISSANSAAMGLFIANQDSQALYKDNIFRKEKTEEADALCSCEGKTKDDNKTGEKKYYCQQSVGRQAAIDEYMSDHQMVLAKIL